MDHNTVPDRDPVEEVRDLIDLGETTISGVYHGFLCDLCKREFFVVCFEANAEEEPSGCPWCIRVDGFSRQLAA